MINRRTFASALATTALPGLALASGFPDKPVRIVVMNAPGTVTDNLARIVANHMSKKWNTSVIVDNKVGGGGTIATDFVAKAPADGATILFTNGAHYAFPWIFSSLPYDPVADFVPVAQLGYVPSLMLVPADSPYQSVRDVIAAAKAQPGKLSFSSAGTGTATHMSGALFASLAGVSIQHVPYKSASQGVLDIAGKVVDIGFGGTANALPLLKGGRIRALAVTGGARSQLLPNVPTMSEAGLKGYKIVTAVFALARAGTPEPIIAELSGAMIAAAKSAEFKEACATNAVDIDILDSAAMKAVMPGEFAKYKNLVVLTGAKAS